MDVQHVAYHLGTHSSNVCWIFRKWFDVMFERLKTLVTERGELCKTDAPNFQSEI